MMPGIDGVETARIIREEIDTDYARNIPIIALTANAVAGSERMFLSSGFQAFISKPIDTVRLDSVLRKWVRNKAREQERDIERGYCVLNEPAEKTENVTVHLDNADIEGVDVHAGMERFGNSENAYVNVLQSFSDNTRPLLGNLVDLLETGNLDDFAITIHGIKGSSLGIGAHWAGAGAERLERLAKDGIDEHIRAENDLFVKYMNALLDSIDSVLEGYRAENTKPVKPSPEPSLLDDLKEACAQYNAGKVDEIMAQLISFDYESGEELIDWLRSQIEDMNYEEIAGGQWPGSA